MLGRRLASAAILIPIVVAVFLLGRPWIDAFVVAVAVLAGWEAFALLASAGHAGFARYGTALAAGFVIVGATLSGRDTDPLLALPALGIVLAGTMALAIQDPRAGLGAWLATAFGAAYVGLLGFAPLLLAIAPTMPPGAPLEGFDGGRGWLLVLVAGVWSYDSFAYAFGRAFGRRRFLQHISPAKTYAGLLGGLAGAVTVSALVLDGLGRSPLEGISVGLLLGIAAQAGDLAESMLKRAANAKDSGSLIPGHGGALDRVDSFLFAAPILAGYVALVTR